MGILDLARSHQQTRDSIGADPQVIPIPKITSASLKLWKEPSIVYDRDIDNSWIVGSSTNAIVGTHIASGGGQLVVGDTSNTEVLLRVVPERDQWVNFLRDNTTNTSNTNVYGLLDGTSTATVNTSTHRIDLDAGDFVEWQLSLNNGDYSKVKVIFDESVERTNVDFNVAAGDTFPLTLPFTLGGETLNIFVSTDGGSTWQEITNGVETELSSPGSDIKLRVESSGDGLYWKTKDNDGKELPILVRLKR